MEEWKDIKGYEGIYQVSNTGRVRSFLKKDGLVGYRLSDTPKERALIEHGNGYIYVTLSKDGRNANHYVHRLVAEAFIGDIPKGCVINHIDYNKSNNCSDNLEITTQKGNVIHSVEKMRKPRKGGENRYIRYRSQYGYYEVTVNRKYLGCYKSIEEARKVRDQYIDEINYYR